MNAIRDRDDLGFRAGWALFLVVLAAIPIMAGYRMAPPGTRFVGFVGSDHIDFHGYMAWIRQAREGSFLFRDLFTTEPHRNAFFHPLFWIMGTLSRATGWGILPVWYGIQLLAAGFLVFAIYAFAASLTEDRLVRRLTLILATTASGFGWLAHPAPGTPLIHIPIDTWMVEASVFSAVTSSFFTLTASLALLLYSLARFRRRLDGGDRTDGIVAGLFALGVAVIHPYDLIVLLAVASAWTLLAPGRPWKRLAVLVLIPAPYAAYSMIVLRLHPVFSRVTWAMPVPGPAAQVIGFGLPLLLAAVALAVPGIRRSHRSVPPAAAWVAAVALLLLVPVGFQRKFVWGVEVPLSFLAAVAISQGTRGLGRRSGNPGLVRALVFAAVILAAGAGSIVHYQKLFRRYEARLPDDYLPVELYRAATWLAGHSRPDDVVLAGPRLAPLLPGRAGNTVFLGHWAQTLDRGGKAAFLAAAFAPASTWSPEQLGAILTRNRVRYIAADLPSMAYYGRRDLAGPFRFESLGDLVYENPLVRIWELPADRYPSETTPWEAGDWRGGAAPRLR